MIVVIAVVRGCAGAGDTGSREEFSTDSDPEAKKEAKKKGEKKEKPNEKPKEKEDPKPNFSDGTHAVGIDIQPGTYRTREGSRGCYYVRLGGFSGELEESLANDNANGPAIVTIESKDAGFQSQRCGVWTRVE